jgi:hypothetical protein
MISVSARGLEHVLNRNAFYQQRCRELSVVLVLLLSVILFLLGLLVYAQVIAARPRYFATTPDARPIAVVRLDEPLYADPNAVIQWTSQAVLDLYSLDYVTWRRSLQNAADYFIPEGYKAFMQALKASTNLEAVKAKRQVVSASITGPVTIVRQGQLNPQAPYSWDLNIPLLVVYQNSEGEMLKQKGSVFAQVQRTSLLRYEAGIALTQLILQAET